jgi:hypothetical protein
VASLLCATSCSGRGSLAVLPLIQLGAYHLHTQSAALAILPLDQCINVSPCRLRPVLSQELPSQEATLECGAALHQVSWLLRLQSLLLLRLEHEPSAQALLGDLLSPEGVAGADGSLALTPVGQCIILQVLRRIASLAPKVRGTHTHWHPHLELDLQL